jgi:hypothetical protein
MQEFKLIKSYYLDSIYGIDSGFYDYYLRGRKNCTVVYLREDLFISELIKELTNE